MQLEDELRGRYLDLMRDSILGAIYDDPSKFEEPFFPVRAHTMISPRRMDNIRDLLQRVIKGGIPGDFVETGVWRGGACIYAAAVIKAYGSNKKVWCCDSFEGLPPPNPEMFPVDTGDKHHMVKHLAVSLQEVMDNFKKYNLLDENVGFVKGFFSDTLHTLPTKDISVLRLDGDMYESTIVALRELEPRVSLGGFIIVDDARLPGAWHAVNDYLIETKRAVTPIDIDGESFYWQKDA